MHILLLLLLAANTPRGTFCDGYLWGYLGGRCGDLPGEAGGSSCVLNVQHHPPACPNPNPERSERAWAAGEAAGVKAGEASWGR